MSLPIEIAHEILKLTTDRSSLANYARTCRDLYADAQRRFFASVTLDFSICFKHRYPLLGEKRPPPRRTPTKFLSLLCRAPHIRTYVTELRVNIGELARSTAEEDDLGLVLGFLTQLKSFGFPLVDSDLQIINRHPVVGTLPFLHHLSLQQKENIEELDLRVLSHFGGPDVRLTFLDEFRGLKSMLMPPLIFVRQAAGQIRRQCQLESLTFDGIASRDYNDAIEWLGNPSKCLFEVTNLKALKVKVVAGTMTYDGVERLMRICQNADSFDLLASPEAHSVYYKRDGRLLEPYNSRYLPPNLTALPRLNTLSLRGEVRLATFRTRKSGFRHPVQWMTDLLGTLSPYTQHHISQITIILTVAVQFSAAVLEVIDWECLVDVVLSEKLPALRQLIIRVRGNIPMAEDWVNDMLDVLRENESLVRLIEKGLITFSA